MSESQGNGKGQMGGRKFRRSMPLIAIIVTAVVVAGIFLTHKPDAVDKSELICPLPAGLKLDNAHYSDSLLTADGSRCAVIVESDSKYYLLSDTGTVSVYNPALAAATTRAAEAATQAAAATQPSTTRQYEIEDLSTSQPTSEPQSQPETSEKYNRTYDVGEDAAKIGKGPRFDFLTEPSIGASMDATFSPDGKHLLTITTQSGEKAAIFLDGKEIAKYDSIQSWWFNSQSQLEYIARGGEKSFLITADGKSEAYDSIQSWWFNPQSQLEYIARDGEKSFLITAAGKGEAYDSIEDFVDSSCHDSPHTVFLCNKNKDEKYLIINGMKIGPYKNFPDCRTDSRGEHFACVAEDADGKMMVIIDGKPGKTYNRIDGLTISQSGQSVAFQAHSDDKFPVVVVNGREIKPWEQIEGLSLNPDDKTGPEHINVSDITFSPDGKRLAMRIRIDYEYFACVDGTVGPTCGQIRDLMFSPDSKHFMYCANDQHIVFDGVQQKNYSNVTDMQFSTDGGQYAYRALCDDNTECVVVNGVQQKIYKIVSDLQFSPDGKRYAYRAVCDDDKECVVLDGVQKDTYASVSELVFSPSGKRFAYRAKYNRGEFVVCDDNECIHNYFSDSIVDCISFDKDDLLLYVAGSGNISEPTLITITDRATGTTRHGKVRQTERQALCVEHWQGPWECAMNPVGGQSDRPTSINLSEYTKSYGLFGSIGESQGYARLLPQYILRTQGATHVVYATGGRIFIDGVGGPDYDEVGNFTLSPDGKRYAYSAQRTLAGPDFNPSKGRERDYCFEDKNFVNIDGRELPVAGPAGGFAFSADGSHIAWRVEDEQSHTQHIVLDEIPQPAYRWVSRPVFRADGVIIYYAINEAGCIE